MPGRRQAGFNDLTEEQIMEIEKKAYNDELAKPKSRHKKTDGKRARPDVTERNLRMLQNRATPEEKKKFIAHGIQLIRTRDVDLTNADAVEERVFWYLKQCENEGILPIVPGLALVLHTTKDTLDRIAAGTHGYESHTRVSAFLRDVYSLMEDCQMNSMLEGATPAVPAIVNLKNHFGYRDQKDVHITQYNPLGAMPDAKAIAERIESDIVDAEIVDSE